MAELISWLADPARWSGPDGIPTRLLEHAWLSATPLAAALLVTLPPYPRWQEERDVEAFS